MKKLTAIITLAGLLIGACGTNTYETLTIKDISDNGHEMYLQDADGDGYVIDEPALSDWGLEEQRIGDEIQAELNEYGEILGVR